MNYLELCQDLVAQFGLSGGTGPSAVTGNTGELGNVARWVRDSALYIDNLWEDWRYLWVPYSGTLAAGDSAPSTPTTPAGVSVRLWELTTLKIRSVSPLGLNWQPVTFMTRQKFQQAYDPDIATASVPTAFTVLPDNTIQLDCPADQAYTVKGAFYRMPKPLAANTDTPLLPAAYHRLIIARATIMYANREDAPELVSGAEAEYMDLLDKLEGNQLEGFRYRRRSTQQEEQVTGVGREPSWS